MGSQGRSQDAEVFVSPEECLTQSSCTRTNLLVDVYNHTCTDWVPGMEVQWVPTYIGVKGNG